MTSRVFLAARGSRFGPQENMATRPAFGVAVEWRGISRPGPGGSVPLGVFTNVIDVSDVGVLAQAVARRIATSSGVVTIDGFSGVGKSHLASNLATRLGLPLVELDEILDKNRGCFVESIRYSDLAQQVAHANGPVLVEGVCVQKVLGRLEIVPALAIYVRKLEPGGGWPDRDFVDPARSPEEVIAQQKELDRKMAWIEGEEIDPNDPMPDTLRHEIIRYHYEYEPHLNADYVFDRIA